MSVQFLWSNLLCFHCRCKSSCVVCFFRCIRWNDVNRGDGWLGNHDFGACLLGCLFILSLLCLLFDLLFVVECCAINTCWQLAKLIATVHVDVESTTWSTTGRAHASRTQPSRHHHAGQVGSTADDCARSGCKTSERSERQKKTIRDTKTTEKALETSERGRFNKADVII